MFANYHTHTWRCNHAEGTEVQYVRNAVKNGVKILGFSDHTPHFYPNGYYSHNVRMTPEQLTDYVETVERLREKFRDQIEIHIGLEAEYYPELFPKLLDFLKDKPIEYLLLGQHFLGNETGEFYCGTKTEDENLLARYCNQSMAGMNTGRFTYFAHPDLINFTGDKKIYKKHIRELCREANSCDMPLEINLVGVALQLQYPNPAFWEVAAEENCKVIIGRDAHKPDAFDDHESERKAMQIVEKYGLKLIDTVDFKPVR